MSWYLPASRVFHVLTWLSLNWWTSLKCLAQLEPVTLAPLHPSTMHSFIRCLCLSSVGILLYSISHLLLLRSYSFASAQTRMPLSQRKTASLLGIVIGMDLLVVLQASSCTMRIVLRGISCLPRANADAALRPSNIVLSNGSKIYFGSKNPYFFKINSTMRPGCFFLSPIAFLAILANTYKFFTAASLISEHAI